MGNERISDGLWHHRMLAATWPVVAVLAMTGCLNTSGGTTSGLLAGDDAPWVSNDAPSSPGAGPSTGVHRPGAGSAGGSSAAASSSPTTTLQTALTPADAQVRDRVANKSVRGRNLAGQSFCTYYASSGTSTTVTVGGAPSSGTWSVHNGQVCETTNGGYSYCSSFAFSGSTVAVTPVSGTGAFPFTGTVSNGNACGSLVGGGTTTPAQSVAATPTTPAVTGLTATRISYSGGAVPPGTFTKVGQNTWVQTVPATG